MMKLTTKFAAAGLTAAMLAVAVPVQASWKVEVLKECLAKAEQAANPQAAKNRCVWEHWQRMASYN